MTSIINNVRAIERTVRDLRSMVERSNVSTERHEETMRVLRQVGDGRHITTRLPGNWLLTLTPAERNSIGVQTDPEPKPISAEIHPWILSRADEFRPPVIFAGAPVRPPPPPPTPSPPPSLPSRRSTRGARRGRRATGSASIAYHPYRDAGINREHVDTDDVMHPSPLLHHQPPVAPVSDRHLRMRLCKDCGVWYSL